MYELFNWVQLLNVQYLSNYRVTQLHPNTQILINLSKFNLTPVLFFMAEKRKCRVISTENFKYETLDIQSLILVKVVFVKVGLSLSKNVLFASKD